MTENNSNDMLQFCPALPAIRIQECYPIHTIHQCIASRQLYNFQCVGVDYMISLRFCNIIAKPQSNRGNIETAPTGNGDNIANAPIWQGYWQNNGCQDSDAG